MPMFLARGPRRSPNLSRQALLAGACCFALLVVGSAHAQSSASNQTTQTAGGDVAELTVIARAQPLSPSIAAFDATEPTSSVATEFLRNNIIPLASVDDIIKYQPSVWSQNPNGPGIGKAQTISLRGFQDSSGQFNMTFDGIPFGDATDLHHTTSSIFIAHDLGAAEIDRGPGTGSTIGKATFGGTVGFTSKTPDPVYGLEAYATAGSFSTYAGGIEADFGRSDLGSGFFDIQHEETAGYQTGSAEHRTNVAAKYEFDLAPNTTLTVLGSYNNEFQFTTQGATLASYKAHGDDYGLCYNPALQCYYGYQPSRYTSGFFYADLKTVISGVRVQNTVYDDSFEHDYSESKDASDESLADNTVTLYNASTLKKIGTYADIPGKRADAQWNAFGDILRLAVDTPLGELRSGVWVEEQDDHRYSYNTDLTKDVPLVGKTGTAYSYNYKDTGVTWQPYVELEWKPIDGLSIIPGAKYTSYRRSLDAILNKGTLEPLQTAQTYDAVQPSIAANYKILSNWSAYAQVARGFQAPPIALFQVSAISSDLKAEETTNYQLGTTWKNSNLTLAGDVYYIDFSNYLASSQVAGTNETTYINGGGVIYQGVELEGQYAMGGGFSLYGNYSYNDAKYKHTDITLAEVPEWIAAAGILFDNHAGPYFSVIGKFVGPRYGDDGTVSGTAPTGDIASTRISTDLTADLAAGYHFKPAAPYIKAATISVKVSNLFNNRDVSDFAGYQAVGSAETFWRNPGISAFLNFDGKF